MAESRDRPQSAGLSRGDKARYSPCERLRRGRGWSQVRLAGLSGMGVAVVQAVEAGRVSRLRLETLFRLGRALGCSVADLVPGVVVRESEGGRVQRSGGDERASGRARRELVRRMLVQMLTDAGGRMVAGEVVMRMRERYGVPEYYTKQVRQELGLAGKVDTLRRPGRGINAWEWVLVEQISAPGREAAAPGAASPPR
jgi:transcriptional regulator with XRE-family HTH domain